MRKRAVLAIAGAAVGYVAYLAAGLAIIQYLVATDRLSLAEVLDTVGWATAFVGMPAVGALVATKRPDNPVGWAILAFGSGLYVSLLPGALVQLQVARSGQPGGGLLIVAAIINGLWPAIVAAMVLVLLLFPDGDPGRWGRWLSRGTVSLAAVLVLLRTFRPGRLDLEVHAVNPLGLSWVPSGDTVVAPLTTALVFIGVLAVIGLGQRYRRADRTRRKQFQWVLWSLLALPVLFLVGMILEVGSDQYWLGQIVTVLSFDVGFLGFAFALGRAILKHDLYGIDRIVSRTLSYAVITAVLAGVYALGVLGVGALIPGESSDLLVAGSTLAVAALFQPVRRRVQATVDRRFNRARYDAHLEAAGLAGRLRSQVDLDRLADELAATVERVVQPVSLSVVLIARPGARL